MVPWSIRRVADLPPNVNLREMQQNTHGLVQLIRATTPDVRTKTHPYPQRGLGSVSKVAQKDARRLAGALTLPLQVVDVAQTCRTIVALVEGITRSGP